MISTLGVGLFLCLWTTLTAGLIDGAFQQHICATRHCLASASHIFKAPITIASATLVVASAVAAAGSIFVAAQSYVLSTQSAIFSNHIGQLNAFLAYMASEISKRPRISNQSVDGFRWYRLIFQNAGRGTLEVSLRYQSHLQELIDAIEHSNKLSTTASKESFRYVEHQVRMINTLSAFGITLVRQPRLDYYEIEGQALSLIEAINFAFCFDEATQSLPKREYL
jgi:hypothetical protein